MPSISVIVPTLNEAPNLPRTLGAIELKENDELIVADGGSADDTTTVARRFTDEVVESEPGRAAQLNAGAAIATGDIFLFLHADTLLPPGALDSVRKVMRDGRIVGGAFRLGIEDAGLSLRIIALFANLRSRWFRLPYGDQALFVRRETFEKLGGFAALPIMEDVDFVDRLRKRGRLAILPQRVTTSARRWRVNGTWRTTFTNWLAIMKFRRGRPIEEIRAFYERKLRRGQD